MKTGRLVVTRGPDAGRRFVIPAHGCGIGRGPWNAVQLSDVFVSRSHCSIELRDGSYELVDCGSRFGTGIADQLITEPHRLHAGDRIAIGQTVLVYSPHGQPRARAHAGLDGRADTRPSDASGRPDRGSAAFDRSNAADREEFDRGIALPGSETLGGRYELLHLIGVGGMGSVYKARDLELDEIVALKVVRRALADTPLMVEWFRREVKLARRITHRNVARIFDIGEHGGEKYLTMEFIDGESLHALLVRRGPLGFQQAVDIVKDICAGLAAVHAVGVIHRDLKPDNVLLAIDGRAVITDFGLAIDPGGAGQSETSAALIGTPAYMAPEQVGGEAVDPRADIYALGAMCYELLTGQPPWQGENNVQIATARFTAPPPDPREVRNDVPDGLARIIQRCMAVDPDQRYPDVGAVADELAAQGALHPDRSALARRRAGLDEDAGARRIIAILPFHNAGSADDDFLATGTSDDLADILAVTAGLAVIPRWQVAALTPTLPGAALDRERIRALGVELGAELAITGSVARRGDTVAIAVRMHNVLDGFQLWAAHFERPAGELLLSNEETARAIARALALELGCANPRSAIDPLAVDLYLRGSTEYRKLWPPSLARAIELFDRALAIAPDDPTILAAAAMTRARQWFFLGDSSVDVAAETAERAVTMAPNCPEARLALAMVRFQSGDPVSAMYELERALSASPDLTEGRLLVGRILLECGHVGEAVRHLERAVFLDPGLHTAKRELARAAALTGDREANLRWVESHDDSPDNQTAVFAERIRYAVWFGDRAAAKRLEAEIAAKDHTRLPMRWLKDLVTAFLGGPEGMAAIDFDGFARGGGLRRRVYHRQVETEIASAVGWRSRALTALHHTVKNGLVDITWMDLCPVVQLLHDAPEFPRLRSVVDRRANQVTAAWREVRAHIR